MNNYLESFTDASIDTLTVKDKHSILPKRANRSNAPSNLPRWVASAERTIKANFDDGWESVIRKAEIGIVVSDYLGLTILFEWKFISH
jgi:hypothetical protein